jgi:hypothetical protein
VIKEERGLRREDQCLDALIGWWVHIVMTESGEMARIKG